MSIENQKDKVNILLQLIKENPNLEILPMVATDCVGDDCYGYWSATWGDARVTKYYIDDDRIYEYDSDFEDLLSDWICNNYEHYNDMTDDELDTLAEEKIESYNWIDAIIVYIES